MSTENIIMPKKPYNLKTYTEPTVTDYYYTMSNNNIYY